MPSFANWLADKVASLFGYSLPSFEDNPEAEQAAIDAAQRWLALIDKGKYSESWKRSAPKFREAMSEDEWIQETCDTRTPLGPARSREVALAKFTASLPGSVEGEHVIIRFDTRFEHKENAVEMVTFAKAEDGSWRSAAGYHVK